MKVNGYENAHMSELAELASWADLKKYYDIEGSNISQLIRGETKVSEYQLATKKNQILLNLALTPEMSRKSEHSKNFKILNDNCEELSSVLIGRSKALASN